MSDIFRVSSERLDGDFGVVSVAGEVDIFTAPQLKECLVELLDSGVRHLVVDLSDHGIHVLVHDRCPRTAWGKHKDTLAPSPVGRLPLAFGGEHPDPHPVPLARIDEGEPQGLGGVAERPDLALSNPAGLGSLPGRYDLHSVVGDNDVHDRGLITGQ